jgi:hypothetical protein
MYPRSILQGECSAYNPLTALYTEEAARANAECTDPGAPGAATGWSHALALRHTHVPEQLPPARIQRRCGEEKGAVTRSSDACQPDHAYVPLFSHTPWFACGPPALAAIGASPPPACQTAGRVASGALPVVLQRAWSGARRRSAGTARPPDPRAARAFSDAPIAVPAG